MIGKCVFLVPFSSMWSEFVVRKVPAHVSQHAVLFRKAAPCQESSSLQGRKSCSTFAAAAKYRHR